MTDASPSPDSSAEDLDDGHAPDESLADLVDGLEEKVLHEEDNPVLESTGEDQQEDTEHSDAGVEPPV